MGTKTPISLLWENTITIGPLTWSTSLAASAGQQHRLLAIGRGTGIHNILAMRTRDQFLLQGCLEALADDTIETFGFPHLANLVDVLLVTKRTFYC